MKIFGAAAAATLALCSGCQATVSLPARAAQEERSVCSAQATAEEDQNLIRDMPLVSAESWCHIDYCNGVGQVYAVRLVIRKQAGVSAAQLAGALRCHSARVVLGESERLPNDPYWLPDSWVDIDVRDKGDSFLVTLTGQSVADNLHILHRATAFAAERRGSSNR